MNLLCYDDDDDVYGDDDDDESFPTVTKVIADGDALYSSEGGGWGGGRRLVTAPGCIMRGNFAPMRARLCGGEEGGRVERKEGAERGAAAVVEAD